MNILSLSLSLLASIAIAAVITLTLINAPQHRVNFNQSGITLSK